MPTYDYDCVACGTRFEVVHGVHAESPASCPVCGAGPVKKAFAPPTIHFKGSGWAKMERRGSSSPGSPTGAKAPGGEAPATASSDGAAGDPGSNSKPAVAPASPPASGSTAD